MNDPLRVGLIGAVFEHHVIAAQYALIGIQQFLQTPEIGARFIQWVGGAFRFALYDH